MKRRSTKQSVGKDSNISKKGRGRKESGSSEEEEEVENRSLPSTNSSLASLFDTSNSSGRQGLRSRTRSSGRPNTSTPTSTCKESVSGSSRKGQKSTVHKGREMNHDNQDSSTANNQLRANMALHSGGQGPPPHKVPVHLCQEEVTRR